MAVSLKVGGRSSRNRAYEWGACLVCTNKQKEEREVDKRSYFFFFNLTQPAEMPEVLRGGSPRPCSPRCLLSIPSHRGAAPSQCTGQCVCVKDHAARHEPKGASGDSAGLFKPPKSWSPASEGGELNIGKHILEKHGSFTVATDAHLSQISCLLNIHSNFRERETFVSAKPASTEFLAPGWLSARLQSELLCELLPPQQSVPSGQLHLPGGLQDAFLSEMYLQGSVDV